MLESIKNVISFIHTFNNYLLGCVLDPGEIPKIICFHGTHDLVRDKKE